MPKRHYKSKYYRKSLLFFVIVCTVPMLVFTTFFYKQIVDNARNETRSAYEQTAGALVDSINERFEEIYSLSARLKLTKWVIRLRSNNDILFRTIDINRSREIQNDITLYETLIGVSDQIGVYLPFRDMAFTTQGLGYRRLYLTWFPITTTARDANLLMPLLNSSAVCAITNLNSAGFTHAKANDLLITCNLDELNTPRAVMYAYISGASMEAFLIKNGFTNVSYIKLKVNDDTLCAFNRAAGEPKYVTEIVRNVVNVQITYEIGFPDALGPTGLT